MVKKIFLISFIVYFFSAEILSQTQNYKVVTDVESIVLMKFEKSRIVDDKSKTVLNVLTTERSDVKNCNPTRLTEKVVKSVNFEETKLLNFYLYIGSNFQNVISNDAEISAKNSEVAEDGRRLMFASCAVNVMPGNTMGWYSYL